ncbi:MAG: DUF3307 domain-containing protein [Caldilineaceae bacterium]|nr:DUF3307 domain-containing protein [Caldilineaceae bacterium]
MDLIAALFLSHLIGDFPLQTNQIYRLKNESWVGIVLHVAIHLMVTGIMIRPSLTVWPLFVILGVLHFLIDLLKLRLPLKQLALGFLLDQGAHLLVLYALAQIWAGTTTSVLPLPVLLPMIGYALMLATLVFFWVLANELTTRSCGERRAIHWASTHLLELSQYAGLPLLFVLSLRLYQAWL